MTGLILLHGFTGAPASFDGVVNELASHRPDLRIYRPQLLGHGARLHEPIRRFEQEVDRLALQVRRDGMQGAHLCGYSLGARLALGLVARHGYLFRSATLIGVHPGLSSPAERAQRAAKDARWCGVLAQRGLRAFVDAWQAQPLFESQRSLPAARISAQRATRLRHRESGLIRALQVLGLSQMPNYRGALANPSLQLTLVAGALDEKFVQVANQLSSGRARVRRRIVAGVGHNVVLEAPQQIACVLREALSE